MRMQLSSLIRAGKITTTSKRAKVLKAFTDEFFSMLLSFDSKYDEILEKNKEFQYNWKFNLSQGSIAKKVNDILRNYEQKYKNDKIDDVAAVGIYGRVQRSPGVGKKCSLVKSR